MASVELHQAFLWTCNSCGRDNFARAVTLEPASIDLDDEPEEVREWLADGQEGAWLTTPDRVTCGHCRAEFDVES